MDDEENAPGMSEDLGGISRMGTQVVAPIGGVDDSTMDELIEKLKMLNYETGFSGYRSFRPLTRSYFTRPATNPNEQFFCFTSLVAWLLQLTGASTFAAPGQFDDPNASCTAILAELKRLDFNVRDVVPGKLRVGFGEHVLHVLNQLLDKALVSRGYNFKIPEYPPDTYEEEVDADDSVQDDDIQDEANSESGAEEEWYDGEKVEGGGSAGAGDRSQSVVDTFVHPDEWRMELERVTPMLKLSRRPDLKDWRSHLDWITSLLKTIDKMYPDVRTTLERVIEDITKASEKIQKREQSLTAQFEGMVEQFKTHKKEHLSILSTATASSETVGQLSAELAAISELLEKAKADISARESKMTDTTPLVKIKEAMARIRAEVRHMELRIGVLQHTLLHHKLRHGRAPAGSTSTKATAGDLSSEGLGSQASPVAATTSAFRPYR